MDSAYLQQQIDRTKAQIDAYNDAILALTAGGHQSYQLDTGQSTQRVTRLELDTLQKQLDALYNRLVVFEARRNGSGVMHGRPDW